MTLLGSACPLTRGGGVKSACAGQLVSVSHVHEDMMSSVAVLAARASFGVWFMGGLPKLAGDPRKAQVQEVLQCKLISALEKHRVLNISTFSCERQRGSRAHIK
eukprot:6471203-Amphidinium_carterae.1